MSDTTKDLISMAEDFNAIIDEQLVPGPFGYFAVFPARLSGAAIIYRATPICCDDETERPYLDPEDDDSGLTPVRDYLLNEMETMGKRMLDFVASARGEVKR